MSTPQTISGIIEKYPDPKIVPIKCRVCKKEKLPNEFDKENLISKNIICKECVKKQFGEEDENIDEIIRKRNEERNKSREQNLIELNKPSLKMPIGKTLNPFLTIGALKKEPKEPNYPESVFPMDLGGKKKTQKRRRNNKKTTKKNKKNNKKTTKKNNKNRR